MNKERNSMKCEGCTTPKTCEAHGCATPTVAQKIEIAKEDAHLKLDAAEKAWHTYAALCDVGRERERAFEIFESVRTARRV
jgi:hypothetical protein